MNRILLSILSLIVLSCASGKTEKGSTDSVKEKYANEIKPDDLKEHLFLLSSDILEGRKTGEKRQVMAVNYFTAYYEHIGLIAPDKYPYYTQEIPQEYFENKSEGPSKNILAFIKKKMQTKVTTNRAVTTPEAQTLIS